VRKLKSIDDVGNVDEILTNITGSLTTGDMIVSSLFLQG